MIQVQYLRGVYVPAINLWLDPADAQPFAFVSHAHSDHTAPHQRVIVSEPTARLMQARLGGTREEIVLAFGQIHHLDGWQIRLLPAGHIFGSAQIHITDPTGDSFLYTGDFKVRPGLSAEPIESAHASTLIMETTYGLPQFVFPPTDDVICRMIAFCRDCVEDGEVPVLLGYSLGKAQEIVSGLDGAGLCPVLHPTVAKMTAIYEKLGRGFPPYKVLTPETASDGVVVCPPNVARSRAITSIRNRRVAVLTGWAVDPSARFRYGCDDAFPLSDHAGYDDLLAYVERVNPQRILTLHGYAQEFAADLRLQGREAWALTGQNQIELALDLPRRSVPQHPPGAMPENSQTLATSPFYKFALLCEAIAASSGKLRKRDLLADYLQSLPEAELRHAAVFLAGRPFPQSDQRVMQAGWALIRRALLKVSRFPEASVREIARRHRDAGKTTTEVLTGCTQPVPASLAAIAGFFDRLAAARGPLIKSSLLEDRLMSLSALEAGCLVRILTGDLRIGLKDGLLEESISCAFACPIESVREVHMFTGDLGQTVVLAKNGQTHLARMEPLRPIKCMLASPEPDAAAVWRRFTEREKASDTPDETADSPAPPTQHLWVEDKFDGIRAQLHHAAGRVEIFSRDLKNVTDQFRELARNAQALTQEVVFDGEIIAYQEGRKLTFFDLQKRLGRRDGDLFMGDDIPVVYVVFDLLWLNGEALLAQPLRERRQRLDRLRLPPGFRAVALNEVESVAEIDRVFREARDRGNEGLMIKDPQSAYTPGRRGYSWVKLKKELATLDVVVTAVEQGHGRRSGVLSDYTFAVRDATGALRNIGKAYSGLTDAEIAELTTHFEAHALERRGAWIRVEPNVVLEVAFDSIQPSSRHDSGLAMRFPRIKAIRKDKTVADIDSLATAEALAR